MSIIICDLKKVKSKKWSLEQLLVEDYDYFQFVLNNLSNYRNISEMKKLDYVSKNFIPEAKCIIDDCENPAYKLSIAGQSQSGYNMGLHYAYCSKECWDNDPAALANNKRLFANSFDTLNYFPVKHDKKQLIKVLLKSMGHKGKRTKENLYELFANIKTK